MIAYVTYTLLILFVISFLFTIVGLIAPKITLFWYKKNRTRRLSTLFYGLSSIFCIVLWIGAFVIAVVLEDSEPVVEAPKNPKVLLTDSLLKVAKAYSQSDQIDQARLNYDKIIGLKGLEKDSVLRVNLVSAYKGRGKIYKDIYQNQKALLDYENASKLEKNNISILLEIAELKFLTYDYKSSISVCDQVLKMDTANADALTQRSISKEFSNDFNAALLDINKALFIYPSRAGYYSTRGRIYAKLNDLDKACKDYHKASDLGANVARELKVCQKSGK
ncbi:tetratricopeptide repeat protein [Pedobacter nutrimenti]|uniref:Uncharacterized protein n=1 Tax=Pedobacter nutrimenti TaxID=1241337 RepID=A0A318UCZ0_9SPHI|nr:hypothetical protein [Pedobacter nutrimenti]PYF74081.1 hypothetical protein B0O44_104252 [Pedobacter nutrimenti]